MRRRKRGLWARWLWILLLACLPSAARSGAQDADLPLTRIAFGSCFRGSRPHDIWESIERWQPELLVLLGDNVYADTEKEEEFRAAYDVLRGVPAFQRLRGGARLLATWDDHDYGRNDGGAEFPARELSQRVLLDFLEVAADDPRRSRAGVFHSETFGPPGRRVQVILLDTRYHRGPLERRSVRAVLGDGLAGPYRPSADPDQRMLGEEQWVWLEARLREPAELRLLASSIQVVSEDHGFESWSRLPRERERLTRAIREAGADGVIVLSGDRHLAELSVLDLARASPGSAVDVGYPLLDVTASSFNSPVPWNNGVNRHRLGSAFHGGNFGTIEIEWSEDPRIAISIRNDGGGVVIHHALTLSLLSR